jgi:uncharacterized LabA/DUF88 family protein
MKTNFYVDGFNLYYRAVRSTPYKWLDLLCVAQRLAPRHAVNRIRYFTANAHPLANDPDIPVRQEMYIRALETVPDLSVHRGQFKRRQRRGPLRSTIAGLPNYVDIEVYEEKGTDVNLATHLLVDAYEGDCEQAIVVSNDSDLALPITMVRSRLGLPIGVVNPNRDPKAITPAELSTAATFTRHLRESTLRACQFPTTLSDAKGRFTKPSSW